MSLERSFMSGLKEGRKLSSLLLSGRKEWPRESDRYYIPEDLIIAVGKEEIEKELQNRHPELSKDEERCRRYVNIVFPSLRRLFILLICFGSQESLISAIDELARDQVGDIDLPVHRGYYDGEDKYVLCIKSHNCGKKEHRTCGVPSLSGEHIFQTLHRDQWSVKAAVFRRDTSGIIPHNEFHESTIMPFIEDNQRSLITGGYGQVWSVRMHPAHQNLLNSSGSKAPRMAIKRLLKPNDFQKEYVCLRDLSRKNHPHLMRLLYTYKFKGDYHFIFPYARKNLRDYWASISLPFWNQPTLLWSIQQVSGLVSALTTIHDYTVTPIEGTTADQLEPGRLTGRSRPDLPAVKLPRETFGRHGDLKPENILYVEASENPGSSAILQIADFGLGRFHRVESRSNQAPRTIGGSATYAPPELGIGLGDISRAYDIWGLGCVLLEFIIWLVQGSDGLKDFNESRNEKAPDGFEDDVYYTTVNGILGAEVRKAVKVCIAQLRQQRRYSRCLDELLTLIEKEMLRIKPGDRASAELLKPKIENILESANGNPEYLLGTDEAIIQRDRSRGIKQISDETIS